MWHSCSFPGNLSFLADEITLKVFLLLLNKRNIKPFSGVQWKKSYKNVNSGIFSQHKLQHPIRYWQVFLNIEITRNHNNLHLRSNNWKIYRLQILTIDKDFNVKISNKRLNTLNEQFYRSFEKSLKLLMNYLIIKDYKRQFSGKICSLRIKNEYLK